ncbi:MAG TPA: cytochrome c [Blastocatellia bacterium]|nr:cytochrome c [Blastocatellia bacterium]
MKITITLAAVFLIALCVYSGQPGAAWSSPPADNVTFSKDISAIFSRHCVECHRSGGAAPMPLVTYDESRPWARSIKEKVISHDMPPFHAAGPLGRYEHDPRLSDAEIATVAKWVDAGAPRGDARYVPSLPVIKNEWMHGEPDLVLKVSKPYTVKASPKDQYVFFFFDYVFPEDTWIRGVDTKPGNLKAVHHANTHVVPPNVQAPPDGFAAGDFDPTARGTVMLAGWAPGVASVVLPEGTAIRIPKGMRLGIQVHYAPSEQEKIDQTTIGVYFADGLIHKHMRVLFGDRKDVEIPPGEANYTLVAKKTFETDAIVRFFHVHMHLRGKSYVMKFTYPDGRVETALEVPRYDFNWQRVYLLKEPMRVPKGTVVEYVGTYDNSAKNKFNPDPAKTVRWGEKTTDEMMQGRIFYDDANEDLNLTIRKGRVVGTDGASAKKND